MKESKELSVNYRAQYGDLFCNEENKDLVQTVIEKNVGAFLEELPCRQKMSCNTSDFLILNCGDMSAQSIDNSVTSVGFKIKFTCSPSKCKMLIFIVMNISSYIDEINNLSIWHLKLQFSLSVNLNFFCIPARPSLCKVHSDLIFNIYFTIWTTQERNIKFGHVSSN